MNFKTTVVVYEAQLPELVHEGTDPRSRRAYHLSQSRLTDLRNFRSFSYTVFAEAREQQKNAGESLLTGIKKLVNKVFPISQILCQQMFDEHVREFVLRVKYIQHRLLLNTHQRAIGQCGHRRHPQMLDCKTVFAKEISY